MATSSPPAADRRSPPDATMRLREHVRRLARARSAPLVALAVISVVSLGARAAWLGQPCHRPCATASDHHLIFDEAYYVNAARVIAHVHVPAGEPYSDAPAGVDPNSEHPQLAKLVMAGSIELLGDGPLAWRLGSLVLGSVALLGMFALVRAAGGGRWLAVGAAALMSVDNLLLVHGRIGTLDIYALTPMIWAAALYLRGRHVGAGALVGIGACAKLVAPFVLIVLMLVEGLRLLGVWRRRELTVELWAEARRRLGHLAACTVSALGVFVALLAVLDRVARPYDPGAHSVITGGPFAHIAHMFSYAARESSLHGPSGIASYPWQWLVDFKPIVYLRVDPSHPAAGLAGQQPVVHFLGVISPPILVVALPALALAAWGAARDTNDLDRLGLAWFIGTFVPFVVLSLAWNRTSYLYYMVIVMPGIYLVSVRLMTRSAIPRWLSGLWIGSLLVAAVVMYPFAPVPGV